MSLADVERFSKASPAAAGLLADDTPASLETAVEIASASGYGFTVEEARAFVRRQAVSPDKEFMDRAAGEGDGGVDLREAGLTRRPKPHLRSGAQRGVSRVGTSTASVAHPSRRGRWGRSFRVRRLV